MSGWSPRQQISSASADRDLDCEIEEISRALDASGPTTARRLAELVAARHWGPGRFRRALREALSRGRVVRLRRGAIGHRLYGLPEEGENVRDEVR